MVCVCIFSDSGGRCVVVCMWLDEEEEEVNVDNNRGNFLIKSSYSRA